MCSFDGVVLWQWSVQQYYGLSASVELQSLECPWEESCSSLIWTIHKKLPVVLLHLNLMLKSCITALWQLKLSIKLKSPQLFVYFSCITYMLISFCIFLLLLLLPVQVTHGQRVCCEHTSTWKFLCSVCNCSSHSFIFKYVRDAWCLIKEVFILTCLTRTRLIC